MRSLIAFLFALCAAAWQSPGRILSSRSPCGSLAEPGHIRLAVNRLGQGNRRRPRARNPEKTARSNDAARLADSSAARGRLRAAAICGSTADGRELAGQITKVTAPPSFTSDEKSIYQYELDYPIDGPPPSGITISQDMLREFPYAAGMAWDVSYVVHLKRNGSDEVTTGLLRSRQSFEFATRCDRRQGTESPRPRQRRQGWKTFCEYLRHGVMHILTGYDHLLFVSALVLATLSFWDMVKAIAAFLPSRIRSLWACRSSPSSGCRPGWSSLSSPSASCLSPWRTCSGRAGSALLDASGRGVFIRPRPRPGLRRRAARCHGRPSRDWNLDRPWRIQSRSGNRSSNGGIAALRFYLPSDGASFREGFAQPAMRYGSLTISLCGAYYLASPSTNNSSPADRWGNKPRPAEIENASSAEAEEALSCLGFYGHEFSCARAGRQDKDRERFQNRLMNLQNLPRHGISRCFDSICEIYSHTSLLYTSLRFRQRCRPLHPGARRTQPCPHRPPTIRPNPRQPHGGITVVKC